MQSPKLTRGALILTFALFVSACEFVEQQFSSDPPAQAQMVKPAAVQSPPSATARIQPAPTPTAPPASPSRFAPGFDCNDATWCLGISPNGDISLGNPNDGGPGMKPTGKNVLVGQANRQPRTFVVKCAPPVTVPQDSHVCRAMDSYGNVYGGSIRSPASLTFFRLQTAGSDPPAADSAQFTPGFDCNDATWCLGISPAGDVYVGNPNGFEGGMRPAGKNLLASQSNKQPRSFTIKCVATGTLDDAWVCQGTDSLGNIYGGNSRTAVSPNFFKLR